MKKNPANKSWEPDENKAPLSAEPTSPQLQEQQFGGNNKVMIRMLPGRRIEKAGPGETAAVTRQQADYLISIGYAIEED